MMELIERVSSSARDRQMIHGTFEELNSLFYGQVLNPNLLIIHRKQISIETVPLSWTWAFDVGRNIPVLVPATAVYHPFYDESGPLFINNSCGLASGTNLLEAVIQALCEVIERDALSLAMASNVFRSVPIETINSALCRALITNFHKANIHVTIKEITTNLGVPCFVACSDDRSLRNSFYLNGGYGCHVNRDKALTRAIVELAQSRATIISGAREDIPSMRNGDGSDYDKIRRINYRWFEDVEPIQFYTQLPTYNFNNLWEEFNWLLDCVQTAGLPGPIVADLTRPEVKIPVVRVLVPGLECWYQDHKRIGQRLITAFRIGLKLGVAWKGEG